MYKTVGILLAAVMFVILTACLSFANDALVYEYPSAAGSATYFQATADGTTAIGGYGNGIVDGMLTGTANDAPTNVHIGSMGDALIYAYYNVRGSDGNLFSITNTADYGVRARIRFLEAKHSCEILDFDICLSAKDVWHGIILKGSDGVGTLLSIDTDTAVDYGSKRGNPDTNGVFTTDFPTGVPFRFGDTVSCPQTSDTITKDDTLEGYFIVIAENRLSESDTGHDNCGLKSDGAAKDLWDDLEDVGNVLFGSSYNINLLKGKTYAYNATAIRDFADRFFPDVPTAATPNLASCDDTITGLNFVLTKDQIMGSFYDIGTGTEMIINFPTKGVTTTDLFDNTHVNITAYDDKENSKTTVCRFSPCPITEIPELPYEVNVLSINGANIFSSVVEVPLAVDYTLGWLDVNLTNNNSDHQTTISTSEGDFTTFGLPAIGYVVSDIATNGFNWMLPMFYTNKVEFSD